MEDQTPHVQKNHEIAIALIQKDIGYIKKSVESVTTTLAVLDKNFVRHDELAPVAKAIETMAAALDNKASKNEIHDLLEALKLKVDKSEFDPIKSILGRINWLLIAAFISGLLAFFYKVGTN